jgi:hypothetical protein
MKLEIEIFGTREDEYIDDAIIAEAARVVLEGRTKKEGEKYSESVINRIRRRVDEVRDDEIRAQVRPIIAEALVKGVRKTNTFGDPIGEPVMLRDLIIAEAQTLWSKTADAHSRSRETVLQKAIREEVESVFTKELKAVIAEAKSDVLEAVKGQASQVLTETIERAARGIS